MIVAEIINRENNLYYLTYHKYFNQSHLGMKLKDLGLSQPTISEILRSKRELSDWEAKKIEEFLVIPEGWMDKKDWIKLGWDLIEEYRKLDEKNRKLWNRMTVFIEEH